MRSTALQAPSTASPIEGINWAAVEIEGQAIALSPGQRAPMLALEAATNRFRGFAGCNNISGAYTRSGSSLQFKNAIATRMACNNLDLETRFLKALDTVRSFRAAADKLELLDEGMKPVVRLQLAP